MAPSSTLGRVSGPGRRAEQLKLGGDVEVEGVGPGQVDALVDVFAAQAQCPARALAYLMSQADRQLGGWLAAKLAARGCSVPQWRVLRCLADGQGHPMSEIAGFAMLPGPTLTKLVDRMVAGNLVYRRADDQDRRRVLAYLSERGVSLYRQLAEVVDDGQAELLTALGDDGELARLLIRLSAILASRPGPARSAFRNEAVYQPGAFDILWGWSTTEASAEGGRAAMPCGSPRSPSTSG